MLPVPVQQVRRRDKLTMAQFADRIRVDADELKTREGDPGYSPRPRTLDKLAEYLEVPTTAVQRLTPDAFIWSQGESLEELEQPERIAQIRADHANRLARMRAKAQPNPLRPDSDLWILMIFTARQRHVWHITNDRKRVEGLLQRGHEN